jgi:DNA-binding transcriptional ArsR family regulator
MIIQANFASPAALIGDPVRALILNALMDGRALPAGELAFAAGVTPQTASSHLRKLVQGGLLAGEAEGRHRYFRLAGAHVAEALERLADIRADEPVRRRAPSREAQALRGARRCYNHLAGGPRHRAPVPRLDRARTSSRGPIGSSPAHRVLRARLAAAIA